MGIKKIGMIKKKQQRVHCNCCDHVQETLQRIHVDMERQDSPFCWHVRLQCDGGSEQQQKNYSVTLMNKNDSCEKFYLLINNRMHLVSVDKQSKIFFIQGKAYSVQNALEARPLAIGRGAVRGPSSRNNFIESPLAGRIVRVAVAAGDIVHRGQLLVAIESMKMENEICSSIDGVIKTLFIAPGNLVQPNQPLVEIDVKGGLCGESEKTNDETPIQNW